MLSKDLAGLIKRCEEAGFHPTANHLLRFAQWEEAQADLALRERFEAQTCEGTTCIAMWRGQTIDIAAQKRKLAAFRAAQQRKAMGLDPITSISESKGPSLTCDRDAANKVLASLGINFRL